MPENDGSFDQWCGETSWHGWGDYSRSRSKSGKIFWCIVIVATGIFFVTEIAIMFTKYVNSEKWTTTLYEQPRTHVEFPDIILCNFNQINITRARSKWNLSDDLSSYILGHYQHGIRIAMSQQESDARREEFIAWKATRNDYYTDFMDLVSDFNHKCNETLMKNYFYQDRKLKNPCKFAVHGSLVPNFGTCIRLHFPSEKGNITYAGQQFGLSLLLSVGMEHHTKKLENSHLGFGFALFTLDKTAWPATWIALPTGFHSFVSLKRREETIIKDVSTCEPEQIDLCIRKKRHLIDGITSRCAEHCKTPCERSLVNARTSANQFPSPKQAASLRKYLANTGKDVTRHYIKNNYVALDIFFETTAVQVVYWFEKMPLDQLISSLGGTLGIAAGISVLTVAQILWFLIDSKISPWLDKNQKKVSVQMQTTKVSN